MDQLIAVGGAIVVCLFLFGLPLVAGPYLVRRFGGGRVAADEERWSCPRCGRSPVDRLEANRITPYPGYGCGTCGLRMRPRGTTPFYAALIALSASVLALLTVPVWSDEKVERGLNIRIIIYAIVVGGFCAWQLWRPTPRPPIG